ncbi:hypothetical protein ACS0TY_028862 [Phlomoides rotata]
MRTRSQSKRPRSVGEQETTKGESINDDETLPNISRDAVGKLLKRVKRGFKKEDVGYLRRCEHPTEMDGESKDTGRKPIGTTGGNDIAGPESLSQEAMEYALNPEMDDKDNDFDDSEWEDGSIPTLSSLKDFQEDIINGVSIDFDIPRGLEKRKPVRRATAEEKEVAELVHKAHLLCLLGRGRLIDCACNDPLIQASLLSLVPTHLLKVAESPKLTASHLLPLVNWFHNNFHVRSPNLAEKSCHLALASTLETREGTPEAVTALCVALLRALNLTTRFVSILDVVSLKPDADKLEHAMELGNKREGNIFSSSTLMVSGPSCSSPCTVKSSPNVERGSSQTAGRGSGRRKADKSGKDLFKSQDALTTDELKDKKSEVLVSETPTNTSEPCLVNEVSKRKGDLEFQMQLEMAISATAIESSKSSYASNVPESASTSSTITTPSKKMRKIRNEESQTSSNGISTAIGSKKVGAPLYWAEVFCSGENLTGKWVHVDAVNAITDGEDKVEAAAAACRKSLRYVVAFAGNGAKDVTRRYCTKWYKVAPQRVDSAWWDVVLAPLKELESAATAGIVNLECEASHLTNKDHGHLGVSKSTRSSLEDMELETRALTEPLPTNQQAYRNHPLYTIERWVKKYEILYPKGPVLGFCGGNPVYPRTCVQALHTKFRWLREGLQVKAGEVPVKVLNRSQKCNKDALDHDEHADGDHQDSTALYGKWQTEPLCLPQAVNGIVPKNERGQVDVWSEKCLPPGTVHLPFPRVAHVARRLEIDFAPAMVGFEFRNGRSLPVFEGIVVCSEFKDGILEAYLEEEERREAEEKRKNEAQALSRWYQLLSSIITRQRLNECYGKATASQSKDEPPKSADECRKSTDNTRKREASPGCQQVKKCDAPTPAATDNHEHEFILDEQVSGEEGSTRIKRCHCGFSIQFEEL